MMQADLGSTAKAQDYPWPSRDLFPLKTTLLKNTNETALPVFSIAVVLFPSQDKPHKVPLTLCGHKTLRQNRFTGKKVGP